MATKRIVDNKVSLTGQRCMTCYVKEYNGVIKHEMTCIYRGATTAAILPASVPEGARIEGVQGSLF